MKEIKPSLLVPSWPPKGTKLSFNDWVRIQQRMYKLKNVQFTEFGISVRTMHDLRYNTKRPHIYTICRLARALAQLTHRSYEQIREEANILLEES